MEEGSNFEFQIPKWYEDRFQITGDRHTLFNALQLNGLTTRTIIICINIQRENEREGRQRERETVVEQIHNFETWTTHFSLRT
jgi:hypothetical protein